MNEQEKEMSFQKGKRKQKVVTKGEFLDYLKIYQYRFLH
jgi:hypothetical protein